MSWHNSCSRHASLPQALIQDMLQSLPEDKSALRRISYCLLVLQVHCLLLPLNHVGPTMLIAPKENYPGLSLFQPAVDQVPSCPSEIGRLEIVRNFRDRTCPLSSLSLPGGS